jgi:hypothetical protein
MSYMQYPAQIAAALRALADDFDDVPDVRLPDLRVSVDVQVCQRRDDGVTEWQRIAAVDLLAFAALGVDGAPARMGNGAWYYNTNVADDERPDGLHVGVFAADVSGPRCDAWTADDQLCDRDPGHDSAIRHRARQQAGRWAA